MTPKSQLRFLAGYEQEFVTNVTLGFQYYLEYMLDYGAHRRSLPQGVGAADRDRQVVTARLTWQAAGDFFRSVRKKQQRLRGLAVWF